MSEEIQDAIETTEFAPTTLDAIMGGEDDAPEVETPKTEVVADVEEAPEIEAAEPDEVEEVKDDKADNVEAMRQSMADQKRTIEELTAKIETKPEAEPIDPIDNPEGYRQSIIDENDAKLNNVKWDLYKSDFNNRNPDHKDIEEKFLELSAKKPWLTTKAQALSAENAGSNPLDFVLQVMNEDSVDGIDVEKLTAEITAKVTADIEAKYTKAKTDKSKLRDTLPDDITSESNAGGGKTPAWQPTDLDAIL